MINNVSVFVGINYVRAVYTLQVPSVGYWALTSLPNSN